MAKKNGKSLVLYNLKGSDKMDLDRFLKAQNNMYHVALSEIKGGGASIKIGPGKMGKDILNKTGKRGILDIVTGCPG